MNAPHLPVLYQEIITALRPISPGRYIDGTVGAGGHAWGILQASSPSGRLLGLDIDPQALELAQQRLASFGERAIFRQASYTRLAEQMRLLDWDGVQGIVLDLGVSSMQLENPERGFSFQSNGPLDMRFDPTAKLSAADLVNELPETELAELIWRYGEDRNSRRIASAIVRSRPINTTRQLADLITRVSGSKKHYRIHPATRTFQALRITVNDELESVESVLPAAVSALETGGRLAVIAFHSLEDRLVKQYFHRESRDCICPPEQPICTCGHRASIREITRHPILATKAEIQQNVRAHSARLRVAEKIAQEQ
ncbi:MAG: 16S rRNA (cytosine(1402)-N(4))-methyltransferase RsmH [Anaerolineaceae bacterium]|nr:16S rRNA (cytosine(1402)-N(4))-methyltransferase RsmH [Anaerolineaceae bacterium]